uniref:Uncharacterized protein n=1 Tax=Rhizophora mucronata TaxID=61149 RepID=A0A2P2QHM7_RHIMU
MSKAHFKYQSTTKPEFTKPKQKRITTSFSHTLQQKPVSSNEQAPFPISHQKHIKRTHLHK